MKKTLLSLTSALLSLGVIVGIGFSAFYFTTGGRVSAEDEFVPHVDNLPDNYSLDNQEDYYTVHFFPQPRAAGTNIYSEIQSDATALANGYRLEENPLNAINENTENSRTQYYFVSGTPNRERQSDDGQEYVSANRFILTYYAYFGNSLWGNGGDYLGYWGEETNRFQVKSTSVYRYLNRDTIRSIGTPSCARRDNGDIFELRFAGWTYNQRVAATMGYGRMGDFQLFNPSLPLEYYDNLQGENGKGIDGSEMGDNVLYLYPIFTTGLDYSQVCVSRNVTAGSPIESSDLPRTPYHVFRLGSYYGDEAGSSNNWEENYFSTLGEGNDLFIRRNVSLSPADVSNEKNYRLEYNLANRNNDEVWSGNWNRPTNFSIASEGIYDVAIWYSSGSSLTEDKALQAIRDAGFTHYSTTTVNNNVHIYVQKNYDFKLVGGSTALTYDESGYYFTQDTDSDSDTFVVNDVYFPGEDNFHFLEVEGIGNFRNYVFSVGSEVDWRNRTYQVSIAPDSAELLAKAVNGEDYRYENGQENPKLLKVKERGMYDLTIHVTRVDGDPSAIGTVMVSIQPSNSEHWIRIYERQSDIRTDSRGFIDYDSSSSPLYSVDVSVQGGVVQQVTPETVFTARDGTTTMLSAILANDNVLYDYVTGRRFRLDDFEDSTTPFMASKSYVFYLQPEVAN